MTHLGEKWPAEDGKELERQLYNKRSSLLFVEFSLGKTFIFSSAKIVN